MQTARPSPERQHLVQFLLPLYGNAKQPFARTVFDAVRNELTEAFGGVTMYVRSPAVGVWEGDDGEVARDDVVLVEVMVPTLDRHWWASYRGKLEQRFEQEHILVRASAVDLL